MNLCGSTVHSLYLHSNGTLAIQTPKKKKNKQTDRWLSQIDPRCLAQQHTEPPCTG